MIRFMLALMLMLCAAAPVATYAQVKEPAPGESNKPETSKGDTTAVKFFLPGQFNEALKKAKDTRRCLMIKAIAFGVDDEGAKCATKGHW